MSINDNYICRCLSGVHMRLMYVSVGLLAIAVIHSGSAIPVPLACANADEAHEEWQHCFDGRGFDGWEQFGNWQIKNGALFCSEVRAGGANLHYVAKALPVDFEIVVEWRQTRAISWNRPDGAEVGEMNPGLAISYNSAEHAAFHPNASFGAALDCEISGIAVRLHSRRIADHSPLPEKYISGFESTSPKKDYSRPIGEWNQSRIVGKGSAVELWLNDNRVVEVKLDMPAGNDGHGKDTDIPRLARNELARAKSRGLYLSVISPYSAEVDRKVEIRGIRVRRISADVGPLTEAEQTPEPPAPGEAAKSPTKKGP